MASGLCLKIWRSSAEIIDEHGASNVTHPTDATNPVLENANTQREYEVRRQDLPLSCPTPEQKLWNSHPRVYLPIEDDGLAVCPYCSASYRLVD